MNQSIEALLFDLDGTLINTAPDLIESLQILLERHGKPRVDYNEARPSVPNGSLAIVKAGFKEETDEDKLEQLRLELWDIYSKQLFENPDLFDGLGAAIKQWEQQNKPWGIVTNKPEQFTRPLLAHTGLLDRISVLVCGDSLPKRKPDPLPLLHAAEALKLSPEQCIYVGDDERDVVACRAANMPCLVAAYDFLPTDSQPENWGAHAVLWETTQLLPAIQTLNSDVK